jgi:hypothetical protein
VIGSECILRTKQHLRNGISMNFVDGLKAAVSVSFVFSWIALLIALLPTLLVSFAAETRGWQYAVAGLLGGVAGGFCGATSLFLSFWFACRGQVQGCNTAQGDMGLLVTFPLGSFIGCLLALAWTRLTLRIPEKSPWSSVWCNSGPGPFRNWAYAIASQLVFWPAMIILFARLIA